MQTTSTDVAKFHNKHGFPVGLKLFDQPSDVDSLTLLDVADILAKLGEKLKTPGLNSQQDGDERVYRAHLMVEELAEAVLAMAHRDEVGLADATADLRYVTLGTDVTFGIPSEYVDVEVHSSNMTKAVRTKTDPRMRDKGPNYRPPDVEAAIASGRNMLEWSNNIRKDRDEEVRQVESSSGCQVQSPAGGA